MHLTRGGREQRPLTSGPRGWPVGPTLQPFTVLLHGHALHKGVIRNLKLEVGGSRTRWLVSHVAGPAGQHLACYQLNQVSNSSLDPYKYPPANGIQDTTLYI
jgi:hypothetical protein